MMYGFKQGTFSVPSLKPYIFLFEPLDKRLYEPLYDPQYYMDQIILLCF